MLLAALLSVAVYFIWHTDSFTRQFVGALLAADLLVMVIIVERMIHTHYTVTADRFLVIHRGRFAKEVSIALDNIERIDRINRMRFFGKPLRTSLVIVLSNKKEYYINPKNEEDFIKWIAKRRS